ncbi:F-box protein [Musa troglodytarum]|uniref:F-box protein n=1 Tax=Musa troglodytarum TaxID=320322 RepID=A0A9E7HS02_9LILI|nr:F-box protein [Musa troglodytarum]
MRHLRRLNTNIIFGPPANPYSQLCFSDRNWLLNEVADAVALEIPSDLATAPLFERCSPRNDTKLLAGRWSQLTEMHMLNRRRIKMKAADRLVPGLMEHRSLDACDGINDHRSAVSGKRRALFSVFEKLRDEPKQHNDWFALYKLPSAWHELAGLWSGTFGWPSEDKPEKALFLVLLSYEEIRGRRLLIATKILEGTQRLHYPNGSPMFTVKLDEAASYPFPWGVDRVSPRVEVKKSYNGEGAVACSGFLCADLKPGALYVLQNGLLIFVWEKSNSVITLQRIVLQELLRKGERVPMLPPTADFLYFTKPYSDMFAAVQNG